jgi:hypothetical protein
MTNITNILPNETMKAAIKLVVSTFLLLKHNVSSSCVDNNSNSLLHSRGLAERYLQVNSVTKLELINAKSDVKIMDLFDGQVVNMQDISALTIPDFNINASVSGPVSSVKFGYNGNATFRTETSAAYAFCGNSGNNFFSCLELGYGTHKVTATPTSGKQLGQTVSITFTIINGVSPQVAPVPTPVTSPLPAPVPSPSTPPLPAPTKVPTRVPVQPLTQAPTKVTTKAPVPVVAIPVPVPVPVPVPLSPITSGTKCDTLKACYLINIKTRAEFNLTGMDSYILDPTNDLGYSIRCDTSGIAGAESDFIKFIYETVVQDEFGLPRYMNGDGNAGEWINPVPYLESCGGKTVRIEGHIWSNICFSKVYSVDVTNSAGGCNAPIAYVAPVTQPVLAPAMAPTVMPVRSPASSLATAAPVIPSPPVTAPILPPISVPASVPAPLPISVLAPSVSSPSSGPITGLRLMYTGVNPSVYVLNLAFDTINVVDLQLLSLPSAQFSVDALVASNVKSVIFSNGRIETSFPLAYCGNSGNNFYACPDLVLGANVTITVTAYAEPYGQGTAIASRSTTMQIIRTQPPVAPSPPVAPPVLAPVVPPVPGCSLPKVRTMH